MRSHLARRSLLRRRGITLFEVLISLMIFAAAMAVLAQLAGNGVRAALQSQLQTQAVLRCQSKLAEVAAGIQPLAPVTDAPFPDDPRWTWNLRITESKEPGLLILEVSVSYRGRHRTRSVSMTLHGFLYRPATAGIQRSDQGFDN